MRYQLARRGQCLWAAMSCMTVASLLASNAYSQLTPIKPQAKTAEALVQTADDEQKTEVTDAGDWRSLMPKEELGMWEITDFGTQGEVTVKGDEMLLAMGEPLTGINLKESEKFPQSNFEIELSCKRIEGSDFLCGLTFPVGEQYCSFIGGGWGGSLVGLSSINGMDASENSTSTNFDFENNKWYKFRIRVDDQFVRAWIDDREKIRQDREGYRFSTRIEVSGSKPLGLCAFRSTVAVKDFRWRPIDPKLEAEEDTPAKEGE